ncbi:MAG: hypothetical protein JWO65_676 [Sphingomonas bacterium]|jgi:hypothetical protein|nr:hypothetical protein [Sphingomonas bacterium]
MTRINHDRPELRVLDNLRRELGRLLVADETPSVDSQWPTYLRPVAANPKALVAFVGIFEALSSWLDDKDATISISHPPGPVRSAAQRFAHVIIGSRYDPAYTGRDWLISVAREEAATSREFWGWLLSIAEQA